MQKISMIIRISAENRAFMLFMLGKNLLCICNHHRILIIKISGNNPFEICSSLLFELQVLTTYNLIHKFSQYTENRKIEVSKIGYGSSKNAAEHFLRPRRLSYFR